MKPLTIAALGVAFAALAAGASVAQVQYPSSPYGSDTYQGQYPAYGDYQNQDAPAYNAQSYQNYQNAMSAYDNARDTAARQRNDYDQSSTDYQANQRSYRRQLREYNRARMSYDDEYGPGAYEEYYAAPVPPPY